MNITSVVVSSVVLGIICTGCSQDSRSAPQAGAAPASALPFEQADIDQSGELSAQEAVLVPGLDLLRVDRDRDGRISREEYLAWVSGERGAVAGAGAKRQEK